MLKLVVFCSLAVAILGAPSTKIESRLASTLSTKGVANVLVTMKERPSTVLNGLKSRTYTSRSEQLNTVGHSLMAYAEESQKAVVSILKAQSQDYEVFWITNQVYIREASAELIEKLAGVENVSEISEEFEVSIDDPIVETDAPPRGILAPEWGLVVIEALEAHALPGGNNGTGAIIGGIDSGCHSTHVDLKDNFVGTNYGWLDVTLFGTQTPRDDNGHGTHTIGSIVGLNGIGVAPGAKWIACKALTAGGSGTNTGLIKCGQFMTCPTLPDGTSSDCTKAPHVVSNSWGGGQANPFYNEVINAWHAADIIPVFANGNSGPECQTANSPADSLAGVIGVGSITSTKEISSFSSKGPTIGGKQKPDISAPGSAIRSAWHTPGNDAYKTISGTSMATPHVAGVVALLKANNPRITFEQVKDALYKTADTNVLSGTSACEGVDETVFPNYSFGHGIVNAKLALQSVL